MSNFAERLVARAAGSAPAPGIAILTPRPASRFEPVGMTEIAGETVARGVDAPVVRTPPPPVLERREPGDRPTSAISLQSDETVREPSGEPDGAQVPSRRETDQAPLPAPTPLFIQPNEREVSIEHRVEVAALAHEAVIHEPRQHMREHSSLLDTASQDRFVPAPIVDRQRDIHVETLERRIDAPLARPMMPIDRRREIAEPPAPVISIGKIEVQFLPREQPMPAPRAQAPRTRGFETYARARRGEPR